ncbi:hypothetical protein WME97_26570 [Sorangium sp. So ce367]|uniref:hypothetical protein n=1 Tax=Sorangium sp. So ce367 TaxID=3133305 RepID=UPI003F63C947
MPVLLITYDVDDDRVGSELRKTIKEDLGGILVTQSAYAIYTTNKSVKDVSATIGKIIPKGKGRHYVLTLNPPFEGRDVDESAERTVTRWIEEHLWRAE